MVRNKRRQSKEEEKGKEGQEGEERNHFLDHGLDHVDFVILPQGLLLVIVP